MRLNGVPSVAFIGSARRLELAYPASVRSKIGGEVRILSPDIHTEKWQEHRSTLEQADILLATWGLPPLDSEFFSYAPKLRAVFYAAGTVKGFATEEAFSREMVISSAWKANAIPVAQYAAAATMLGLKGFWQYANFTKKTHRWSRDIEVPGCYLSTVGLVSLGAAGRCTAEILSFMGLKIIAYDPHFSAETAAELGIELVPLEKVFSTSDVVSIHAPLLPETEGMIDKPLLRLMKPGSSLVNTSRGAIVNQADLCKVMRERPDITAIIDVTYPEPPDPDSEIFTLDNILVTPHIAGSLGGEIPRMGNWMVDEMSNYLKKHPLKYQVTPEMMIRMA